MKQHHDSSGFAREYAQVSLRHAEAVDNILKRLVQMYGGRVFRRKYHDGTVERVLVQYADSEVYHFPGRAESRSIYLRGVKYKPSSGVGKRKGFISVGISEAGHLTFDEWELEE